MQWSGWPDCRKWRWRARDADPDEGIVRDMKPSFTPRVMADPERRFQIQRVLGRSDVQCGVECGSDSVTSIRPRSRQTLRSLGPPWHRLVTKRVAFARKWSPEGLITGSGTSIIGTMRGCCPHWRMT